MLEYYIGWIMLGIMIGLSGGLILYAAFLAIKEMVKKQLNEIEEMDDENILNES